MTEVADSLAAPVDALADDYDVIIVGSGYGGAITAGRLGAANAAAGGELRIAVLERGAEHPTGTFPESEEQAFTLLRSALSPMGIFSLERFKTIDVLSASGLGGTSLMNFNVAIVPDREVFQASWPQEFRALVEDSDEGVGGLEEYFGRASRMLGAIPYADNVPLRRVHAFEKIAGHAGAEIETLNITVSDEDRETKFGVRRKKSPNHGGDGTGDNSFSKNTLMTNYLPMAAHFGVELHPGIEVDRIEPTEDGRWRIHAIRRSGTLGRKSTPVTLTTTRVVLSAGTLGTNGILLRSAKEGLALSVRLGKNFSGNGDHFGIAYNTDLRTDTQSWATVEGEPRNQLECGPSINVAMRLGGDQSDHRKRILVEDLSLPRALVDVFRIGLMGLAATKYRDFRPAKLNRWRRDIGFNDNGAMNHSLGFLIMVHDNSDGEIKLLKNGNVKVDWPGAPTERAYKDVEDLLTPAVEAVGGSYIKNPLHDLAILGNHLLTAHPIGGCATADTVAGGVVDHAGRVFDPTGDVHAGLYVADGSVLPRAIGVNPFLTISMFTERMVSLLRTEMGLPAYDVDAEGDDRA